MIYFALLYALFDLYQDSAQLSLGLPWVLIIIFSLPSLLLVWQYFHALDEYCSRLDIAGNKLLVEENGFHLANDLTGYRAYLPWSVFNSYKLDELGMSLYQQDGLCLFCLFDDTAPKPTHIAELRMILDEMLARELDDSDALDASEVKCSTLLHTMSDKLSRNFIKFQLRKSTRYAPLLLLALAVIFAFTGVFFMSSLVCMIYIVVFLLVAYIRLRWVPQRRIARKASMRKQSVQRPDLQAYARAEDGMLHYFDSWGTRASYPIASFDELVHMEHVWIVRSKGASIILCEPNCSLPCLQDLPAKDLRCKPSMRQLLCELPLLALLILLLLSINAGMELLFYS